MKPWNQYYIDIALAVATRSSCSRRQVGAVLVRGNRIISTGCNGTPRGLKNCSEGGCPRCNSTAPSGTHLDECLCSHAEENAVVQAAFHGISTRGAALYCTLYPCIHCAKILINAGIRETIVADDKYPHQALASQILMEAGIIVSILSYGGRA